MCLGVWGFAGVCEGVGLGSLDASALHLIPCRVRYPSLLCRLSACLPAMAAPAHCPFIPACQPACLPACLQVFMLSSEAEINSELLTRILQRGHSRLPVYEGQDKQVGAAAAVVLQEVYCRAGGTARSGTTWHSAVCRAPGPCSLSFAFSPALPACRTLLAWCL